METEYGQNRKYFHNVRFSPEEEKIIRERMEKYNYTRVSDFIRDAVLDKRLTQRQVVEIEPYKIDNNRLIGAALDGKIEWLIRFMEGKRPEVMGEYWNDMIGKDTM